MDGPLQAVFGKKKMNAFSMNKFIGAHFFDPNGPAPNVAATQVADGEGEREAEPASIRKKKATPARKPR